MLHHMVSNASQMVMKKAVASHSEPQVITNGTVIHVTMMDPDIAKYRMNQSLAEGSSLFECMEREEYSSLYLTFLICLVTVGLTASLFVLTVIGWFPDLYSTSKYIGQVCRFLKIKTILFKIEIFRLTRCWSTC